MAKTQNRYSALIEQIFLQHYKDGKRAFVFERDELAATARELGIALPKNLGDVLYSFRYRVALPTAIANTAEPGMEWIIKGAGSGRYQFMQAKMSRIEPDEAMLPIKVPNATPEILLANAFDDEQSLLAKVRYNRLIDLFLGITAHSLQNHLRTTVKGIGQIEIDELYVGINRRGSQFVVPVQAKVGRDRHGVVQTEQDIAFCEERFPNLICRPVSVHALSNNRIAVFELVWSNESVCIVDQKHYILVPASDITPEDLLRYGQD
ncbi:MAG: endonuclease [Kiritimatiellae bacterium]|nr:endonuclease [Kiritimatiellia bacterium]MDD3538292.1 endonuclease [Eubacteriales bacterium]MDD4019921.1 endonuclease [Kiritimatiellia bacterium]MDD4622208.1 endonuclease [Kiritimatiellia bacterium]